MRYDILATDPYHPIYRTRFAPAGSVDSPQEVQARVDRLRLIFPGCRIEIIDRHTGKVSSA